LGKAQGIDHAKPRKGRSSQEVQMRVEALHRRSQSTDLRHRHASIFEGFTKKRNKERLPPWVNDVLDYYRSVKDQISLDFLEGLVKSGRLWVGTDDIFYGANVQKDGKWNVLIAVNDNPDPAAALIHEINAIVRKGAHKQNLEAENDYGAFKEQQAKDKKRSKEEVGTGAFYQTVLGLNKLLLRKDPGSKEFRR